jgi:hypothetical protein
MKRLIIAALLSWALPALAAVEDVTKETEGYGATQQEATTNALVEAVRQVRGLEAGVARSLRNDLKIVVGPGGGALEASSAPQQDAYALSHGLLRSYEVLELKPVEQGYYVRLRAQVPKYVSDVDDAGRKRIAVLPFRIGTYSLHFHGSPQEFASRLVTALDTRFAGSDKVVVVTREHLPEMAFEAAVLDAAAPPEELLRIGQLAGADLLLVGTVHEAVTEKEKGAYGLPPKVTDHVRLSWRLVEAATGKLVAAGEVTEDYLRPESRGSYGQKGKRFEAGELYGLLATDIGRASGLAPEGNPAPAAPGAPASAGAGAAETPGLPATPGSSDKPVQW